MNDILPNAVNPDHLTHALRRSGLLERGKVCGVIVDSPRAKLRSRVMRVHLTYDKEDRQAPSSVIIKEGLPNPNERTLSTAVREIEFYRYIAPAMSFQSVPRCFETHWDSEAKQWYLLLEDLTDSHFIPTDWPLPPTMEQCKKIVEGRARIHAAWWDDKRLGSSIGRWRNTDRYSQALERQFGAFSDRHADLLPRDRRDFCERLIKQVPQLLARYQSHRNLTIIHGDAHVWNCLLPKSGETQDVRFLDWEDWGIDTATADIAYMMATHWYPDRRRLMERSLLDHYHETLLTCGVGSYTRQALYDDYRLSALWQVTRAIGQAQLNIPARVWWNNLERAFLAVEDLACHELLD